MKGDARAAVLNRGALTFSILLANIMQGLDTTIANVALPHIRGSLSASLDQISWVLHLVYRCRGDFALMMVIVTPLIPFSLLVRRPRSALRAERAG